MPQENFYKYICGNRDDIFWRAHSNNKPGKEAFFSQEFRDLVTAML
jgi:hypothetical protein